MYQIEIDRKKKINDTTAIVKLVIMLFYSIVILNSYSDISIIREEFGVNRALMMLSLPIMVFICIFFSWMSYCNNRIKNNDTRKKNIIEIIVLFVINLSLVIYSGVSSSDYKFLFIFVIIITTLEFEKRIGIFVAILSSIVVLFIDLFTIPFSNVSTITNYFEIDLVLSGVFLTIAWILGYYCDIEKEFRQKLFSLANKDEVTNVYNHRYFIENLNQQIQICNKNKKTSALLFIQVNNLKYCNSLSGIENENVVLRKIAKVLVDNVRDNDVVARFSNEKFSILLPDLSQTQGIKVAQLLQRALNEQCFNNEKINKNIKLSISVGVACYEDGIDLTELIKRSNNALDKAKILNKNNIAGYKNEHILFNDGFNRENHNLMNAIKTFLNIINSYDKYTYAHTERVVMYSNLIADRLCLSTQDKINLEYSAYLHDIGKIQIPKEILLKTTKLTHDEKIELKNQYKNAVEIISPIESLNHLVPILLNQNKKYNEEKNIPILSKIIKITNDFDEMTNGKNLKNRKDINQAIKIIVKNKGIKYDPKIADVFIDCLSESEYENKKLI